MSYQRDVVVDFRPSAALVNKRRKTNNLKVMLSETLKHRSNLVFWKTSAGKTLWPLGTWLEGMGTVMKVGEPVDAQLSVEFISCVLRIYVEVGVDELDIAKLSTVINAKNENTHAA